MSPVGNPGVRPIYKVQMSPVGNPGLSLIYKVPFAPDRIYSQVPGMRYEVLAGLVGELLPTMLTDTVIKDLPQRGELGSLL